MSKAASRPRRHPLEYRTYREASAHGRHAVLEKTVGSDDDCVKEPHHDQGRDSGFGEEAHCWRFYADTMRHGQVRVAKPGSMNTCSRVLHSSVLPLAWAFSVTGVVVGFSMLLIVAAANTYTCDILLHAARITGARDYEGLAFAVGGKPFRATVEAFVLLLLYGSMVGTLVQLAEISDFTLKAYAQHLPSWIFAQQGAIPMAILVLLVVLPLCMLPSLESVRCAVTDVDMLLHRRQIHSWSMLALQARASSAHWWLLWHTAASCKACQPCALATFQYLASETLVRQCMAAHPATAAPL